MTTLQNLLRASSIALLVFLSGLTAPPAMAKDIEVFFTVGDADAGSPNVLFILDTSQSMFGLVNEVPAGPYVPGDVYNGDCDPDGYYWTKDATKPDCAADGFAKLDAAQFECPDWRAEVDASGFYTKVSRIAQDTGGGTWVNMSSAPQEPLKTTCRDDGVNYGIDWTDKNKGKAVYPEAGYTFYDGNYLNWEATQDEVGGGKYRIDVVREVVGRLVRNTEGVNMGLMRYGYDGAVVFTQQDPGGGICEVLADPDEANKSSNGAPVVFPVTSLDGGPVPGFKGDTVREQLLYQLGIKDDGEAYGFAIDTSVAVDDQPFQIVENKQEAGKCPIPLFVPAGRSPIGGAMQEAYLYYAGKQWSNKYGLQAALGSGYPYPSVEQSRIAPDSGIYKSPITQGCAKNYIILLSDGTTEQDNDIDPEVQRLPGFEEVVGDNKCDVEEYLDGVPPPSMCVDDMAEYMFERDLVDDDDGLINNVLTFTVGFGLGQDDEADAARSMLQETAQRGGGKFFEAADAKTLEAVLSAVLRYIMTSNTAFSGPAVGVNAFNRTQNLNDLYISLFRPSFGYSWLGNVKKYRLEPDGDIVDANGDRAVDPATGFFVRSAESEWTGGVDGDDIAKGGAAGELEWDARKLYSDLTGNASVSLSAPGNALAALKADVDAAVKLGIQPGDEIDGTAGPLTADELIDWLYGKDIADIDGDTDRDDSRYQMGDPLHGKPLTVIYGGDVDDPDVDDAAVLVITNDGFLHSFDPVDGSEHWAYIPEDLLMRARDLYYNPDGDPEERGYGLDGNIRILRIDNNRNGIIETADEDGKRDRVYIYFGQRRGGSKYFALDISSKTAPKLMWARDYTADGAGQSWSSPTPAKVRIGNAVKTVLFFGGGYDDGQDIQPYQADDSGHGVYMVDAMNGDLLWHSGPPGSGADLQLAGMVNAQPGDVRVIDLTGDGFADRIYASDLGGQVWRYDIFNGQSVAGGEGDRLIEGGLLASLGEIGEDPKTLENTLRFFYGPDPSLITYNGRTFINVAVGSGHRELPASDKVTENWFFSVRDYNPFTPLLASQYVAADCGADGPCHVTVYEDDLVDVTDEAVYTQDPDNDPATPSPAAVPLGAAGWRVKLVQDVGEKALAESRTFPIRAVDGTVASSVFFTTYSPVERDLTEDGCGVIFGRNRLYVVSVIDGSPVTNYGVEGGGAAVRVKELQQGAIADTSVLIFPTPDPDENGIRRRVDPVCLVGLERCGTGISNPPVRTYWRQRGAN
jgi:type IV pilus assembly protein PilY1